MYTADSPILAAPAATMEQVLVYMLSRPNDNYTDYGAAVRDPAPAGPGA